MSSRKSDSFRGPGAARFRVDESRFPGSGQPPDGPGALGGLGRLRGAGGTLDGRPAEPPDELLDEPLDPPAPLLIGTHIPFATLKGLVLVWTGKIIVE